MSTRQADETFFATSYKGNHSKNKSSTMPRKAHKRGHTSHIRGISNEKICVSCAVNRNGLSIAKITNRGKVSTKALNNLFGGRIEENSTLVTDKMNSYVKFAQSNNLDLVQLKAGKTVKGIYNIQSINNYHSQLKKFIDRFNGVSTKYLNNYLVWNNFVNYAKGSFIEKRDVLLTYALTTIKAEKCKDVPNRPELPLLEDD